MTYDGKDQRMDSTKLDSLIEKVNKMEVDFTAVKSYITSESGNHSKLLDSHFEALTKHEKEIYGQADSPGIRSRVGTLTTSLTEHILQDRWIHGTIITLLLFILGKLYLGS